MANSPMATPNITVGMPVYNAQPWVREAIRALLEQSYGDFVLVISDNASTDDTFDVCDSFARRDTRIRLYRNDRNIGVFRNYSKVFQYADTPYFKWASANDVCAATFLEACYAALLSNPAAVVAYPRTIVFTDDLGGGEPYSHDPDIRDKSPVERFKKVLREVRLNNAFNGLIRADALRTTTLDRSYLGSDIVLLAELALRGEIVRIPQHLFFRRVGTNAVSAQRDRQAERLFFEGERRNVLATPALDYHWHCLLCALGAPIELPEKLQCMTFAMHTFWWKRRQIWWELALKKRG